MLFCLHVQCLSFTSNFVLSTVDELKRNYHTFTIGLILFRFLIVFCTDMLKVEFNLYIYSVLSTVDELSTVKLLFHLSPTRQ